MKRQSIKPKEELRTTIENEISRLIKELDDGTLDRRKLDSGLKKLQKYAIRVPWFRPPVAKK